LYDISKDPLEMNNLFFEEDKKSLVDTLKIELVNLVGKTNGIH